MGLVRMEFRQQPEKPSNFFGRDEAGPHDEQLEAAATADARVAVIKKAMLGCELTVDELATAHLTKEEAVHEAELLLERTEAQRKRLTEPPEALGTQLPRLVSHAADVEPEPEPEPVPKKRRRKRNSRLLMKEAKERRHEERDLFND